ncbi:hypothetical protein [Mesorhizobium sp. 2RAF21]|uniref:hypothetical protein n=1 Tax=Mesorhizobium sp. 2RAF21 TaxID=3232995 RepID=UPI003F97BD64
MVAQTTAKEFSSSNAVYTLYVLRIQERWRNSANVAELEKPRPSWPEFPATAKSANLAELAKLHKLYGVSEHPA